MIIQNDCTFVSNDKVQGFCQVTLYPNANIVVRPQSTAVIAHSRILGVKLIQCYALFGGHDLMSCSDSGPATSPGFEECVCMSQMDEFDRSLWEPLDGIDPDA